MCGGFRWLETEVRESIEERNDREGGRKKETGERKGRERKEEIEREQ